MSEDKIERIDEISDSQAPKDIDERIEAPDRAAPNKDHFDSLINHDREKDFNPRATQTIEAKGKSSVLDQVNDIQKKVEAVSKASPDTLIAESQKVIKRIEEVKTKLETPGLEIKGSVQKLLKNKLSHIDESLKISLNRAGLEYTPAPPTPPTQQNLAKPIENFIGLLTHGQFQLQHMADHIDMMARNKQELKPADMLAIQIKMGFVQQEIELFTNILNQGLQSIKTIMNVQI